MNTRSKRASAIGVSLPFRMSLPFSDGAIVLGDQQHLAFAYSGIAALEGPQFSTTTYGKSPGFATALVIPNHVVIVGEQLLVLANSAVTGVTWNGSGTPVALSKIAESSPAGSGSAWFLAAPTPATADVEITASSALLIGAAITGSINISNVDPILYIITGAGTATSQTKASSDDEIVIDWMILENAAPAFVVGADQTVLGTPTSGSTGHINNHAVSWEPGAVSVTMSWEHAGIFWGHAVLLGLKAQPSVEGGGELPPGYPSPPLGVLGRHPKVFVTVDVQGTLYGFGETDLENLMPGNPIVVAGKLLQVSELVRELSEDGWRGTSWDFTIADTTREWRELCETVVIEGSTAKCFIIDDDDRWAGLEPFALAVGEVKHHAPPDDSFRYKFKIEDILTRRFSEYATQTRIPGFVMNRDWLSFLDDSLNGKALPIPLGRMISSAGGGMVPGLILGSFNLSAIGGASRNVIALLFHEGAAAKIQNLFFTPASWATAEAISAGLPIRPTTGNGFYYTATVGGTTGGTEPVWPLVSGATVVDGSVTWQNTGADTVRILIPDVVYPTFVLAPWKPGWDAVSTGQAGQWVDFGTPPHRFTVVFINSDIPFYSKAILDRRMLIAADLFGTTENTDATGAYIDAPEWTIAWIVRNQILGQWDGITNAPIPSINGEYDAINYASVTAARAVAIARFPPDGYTSGTLLGRGGTQQTGFDTLAEQLIGGHLEIGTDRLGRVFLAREDSTAPAVIQFDDLENFESFISGIEEGSNINYLEWMYDYRYIQPFSAPVAVGGQPTPEQAAYSKWGSGLKTRKDDTAIADTKRKKQRKLEMYNIHLDDVANDIKEHVFIQRLGSPTSEGRRAFMCRGGWGLLGSGSTIVEFNTVIGLTATRGLGAAGYVQKRGRVRKIRITPMTGRVQYEGVVLPDPGYVTLP